MNTMKSRKDFGELTFWVALVFSLAFVGSNDARAVNRPCSGNWDCADDEYCWLPVGVCDPEDPVGTCQGRPEACSTEWDPVCGCDYQTHSNACFAAMSGTSVRHVGVCEPCEESPCGAGTYCRRPLGECTFGEGVCTEIPASCPFGCQPVCGCDGETYPSECEAAVLAASVKHFGPCRDYHDGLIANVVFLQDGEIGWGQESGALSYNIYRNMTTEMSPADVGSCWISALPTNITTLQGDPEPGQVWLLQVNANFADGEGPFGTAPDCTPRAPIEPCF